jgi:hypothetical protein
LPHVSIKLSQTSNEQAIEIFYKDSQSLSFDQETGVVDFKGRKIFIYIHGGYWVTRRKLSINYFQNFLSKSL